MRFRSRTHGTRRPKEPLSWERTKSGFSAANVKNNTLIATVFDPSLITTGTAAERFTVRRAILSTCSVVSFGAGAVGDTLDVGLGLCKTTAGEIAGATFPDPLLAAAADREADWLWLTRYQIFLSVAAAVAVAPFFIDSAYGKMNEKFTYDVRSSRRLESDERICLVAHIATTDVLNGTNRTAVASGTVASSVVFQRSMRR